MVSDRADCVSGFLLCADVFHGKMSQTLGAPKDQIILRNGNGGKFLIRRQE